MVWGRNPMRWNPRILTRWRWPALGMVVGAILLLVWLRREYVLPVFPVWSDTEGGIVWVDAYSGSAPHNPRPGSAVRARAYRLDVRATPLPVPELGWSLSIDQDGHVGF